VITRGREVIASGEGWWIGRLDLISALVIIPTPIVCTINAC
jgi:hypothetical protein